MFDDFIKLVREIYQTDDNIPLHEPVFQGNEKLYLLDVIDSTFVSSVGPYVDRFETAVTDFTGAKHAIAVVNGTAALHVALMLAGVETGSEVITQPLTFVATCNAIRYCGAEPVFVDIDHTNLGLSTKHLEQYLEKYAEIRDNIAWNKYTNRRIAACLPMHTMGHPVDLTSLTEICQTYHIPLVEDAAESLGSTWKQKHTGTYGILGALSFNGNKIITTGGGGMVLTDNNHIAQRAKHLTTTAKIKHPWKFHHDSVGYNYRMPNLNAAIGVAQLEKVHEILEIKREVSRKYENWCENNDVTFIQSPKYASSNKWLNSIVLDNKEQRDQFIKQTNNQGVMTRPLWEPMYLLPMYKKCHMGNLKHCNWAFERVVCIPSSVPQHMMK